MKWNSFEEFFIETFIPVLITILMGGVVIFILALMLRLLMYIF